MEEHSFQEKDNLADCSTVHRFSESRPKFKPVLVKKLLADESDDDSDDQALNSDNSDEELDDFDSFQPLPDECNDDLTIKASVCTTDLKLNNAEKEKIVYNNDSNSAMLSEVNSDKTNKNSEISEPNENLIKNKETEENSVFNNYYLKDSLKVNDYAVQKDEEDLPLDKPVSGTKRKSCKSIINQDSTTLQSQWQLNPILDKRNSLPLKDPSEPDVISRSHSPDVKQYNVIVNHVNEIKDKPIQDFESFTSVKDNLEHRRHSSVNFNIHHNVNSDVNDDKVSTSVKIQLDQGNNTKMIVSHPAANLSHAVIDTPMKHPQGTSRPNPCHSHRNIFQTPQSKMSSEFSKNPLQTPATIFSHWSQHHMAQTPMQNQMQTRDNVQTPVTSVAQAQNIRHETPRYFSGEAKSVRRPLAETMYSGPVHVSQLPRLQEVPNESQQSPPISRESSNTVLQDNVTDKKLVYSSSHTTIESNENCNPNSHDILKAEIHGSSQAKFSISENRHLLNSQSENIPKLEYRNNTYQNNVQVPRSKETYNNYQIKDNHNVHPSVKSQQEQLSTIQCAIPQQNNSWNSRQNKIIIVKDRQYLVLGVLGHGMSCEVVRAQDLSNSELRAIKCVNLSKMDKDSAQGCLQEICMLDKLKAPCIVHMYNFEIKQPWVYVVMEIGDTDLSGLLKSMLKEKKRLPLTMILYYWTEMLTAVKHIHENGVIHSDLKPANFLLVRGRLKLIDFGIASNINSDMTSVLKNCPIGTVNYISPEALMDVNATNTDSPNHNVKFKISYKSDVWSLGCILYGLVYGVTPFNHIRHAWAKINAITDPKVKINFPLMNESEPVPLILINVMQKCLQRDPKARPTVADLLEIPYLQSNISPSLVLNIPSNILLKIKHALTDEEWQEFTKVLENKKKNS